MNIHQNIAYTANWTICSSKSYILKYQCDIWSWLYFSTICYFCFFLLNFKEYYQSSILIFSILLHLISFSDLLIQFYFWACYELLQMLKKHTELEQKAGHDSSLAFIGMILRTLFSLLVKESWPFVESIDCVYIFKSSITKETRGLRKLH